MGAYRCIGPHFYQWSAYLKLGHIYNLACRRILASRSRRYLTDVCVHFKSKAINWGYPQSVAKFIWLTHLSTTSSQLNSHNVYSCLARFDWPQCTCSANSVNQQQFAINKADRSGQDKNARPWGSAPYLIPLVPSTLAPIPSYPYVIEKHKWTFVTVVY